MPHTLADVLSQLRVGDWAIPTATALSAPTPVSDLVAFEAHSDLLPDGVYRDEGLATWLWDRVTRKVDSVASPASFAVSPESFSHVGTMLGAASRETPAFCGSSAEQHFALVHEAVRIVVELLDAFLSHERKGGTLARLDKLPTPLSNAHPAFVGTFSSPLLKLPSLIADKVVVDGEKPAAPTWEAVRDRVSRLVVELRSAHATSTLFRAIDDALLHHVVRFDRGVQDNSVHIALAKIIVETRILGSKNILFEDTVSYLVGQLVSNPNGGYNVLLSPLLPLRPRPGQAPTLPQVITATCFTFESDASDCDARISAAQATTLPDWPYHDANDPSDSYISSSEDEVSVSDSTYTPGQSAATSLVLLNPQGHAVFPEPLPPRESTPSPVSSLSSRSASSSVGSHRELSEFGSYRSRTTMETSFASLALHSPSPPHDEPNAPFDKAFLLSDAATGSASTTTPTRGGLVLQILRTHAERQTCVIFDAALAPSPSSAPTHVVKMDWVTGESALEHEVAMHAALQGSAQGTLAYGDLVVPLWGAYTVPSRPRRPGERVVAVFEHGGSAPLAWSEVPLDLRVELVVKLAKLHQQHRLVHGDARPSNVAIASSHPPTDPLATPTLGTLELDDAPSSSSQPQPQARWTDLGRAVPHVDPCRGRKCAELRRVALEMGLAEDMATKRAVARAMQREGLVW